MKKILVIIIVLLWIPATASVYDNIAAEIYKKIPAKKRKNAIAVMPFNAGKAGSDSGEVAVSGIEKALVNKGAVLTERRQIDKLIREQELQMTGLVSDRDAYKVGRGVGARYILLGTLSVINRYGESENKGLRISVRLVDVHTYRVIAVSSGDVALNDSSSKYRRQIAKKPSEYPGFLELYGGMTILEYKGEFDKELAYGGKTIEKMMDPGYILGVRYVNRNSGFFTMAWEFNHTSQKMDSVVNRVRTYQVSWIPIVRLPLWTYADILSDYTNLYVGYAVGLGINNVNYTDVENGVEEKKSSKGLGVCSSVIGGLKVGITEAIAFFGEFRYAPDFLNKYWRSHEVNGDGDISGEKLTGPSFYFGISFVP